MFSFYNLRTSCKVGQYLVLVPQPSMYDRVVSILLASIIPYKDNSSHLDILDISQVKHQLCKGPLMFHVNFYLHWIFAFVRRLQSSRANRIRTKFWYHSRRQCDNEYVLGNVMRSGLHDHLGGETCLKARGNSQRRCLSELLWNCSDKTFCRP